MSDIQQRIERARAALDRHGQAHVLRFVDRLDEPGKRALLEQIESIDLALIDRLVDSLVMQDPEFHLPELTPPGYIPLPGTPDDYEQHETARQFGERVIREGKLAAFVVAGGQGTRLGYDGPKGCFPAGPVSGKSLFRMHAEKIRAAERAFETVIPWYVMTSHTNHDATETFFKDHGYFGLLPDNVMLFRQAMIPAVDRDGKFLLDAPDRIFMNPNGHGGSLRALVDSGALDDMRRRGIEQISYFQVDNTLIEIVDPVFVGYHVQAGCGMSSKGCAKRDPYEKVGNFARRPDGRLVVVEYSDMPDELAERRDDEGELQFKMGSIAIHMIACYFARRMGSGGGKLPYHRADKAVPHLDESGELVQPTRKNAVKFETFIFDALPESEESIILEIDRAEQFSPIKNASGQDSPETARRDQTERFARWLEQEGVRVPRDSEGRSVHLIEISPLYARTEGDLGEVVPDELTVDRDLLLE